MFKCVILLNFKRIKKILKTLVAFTGFPRKVKKIKGSDGSLCFNFPLRNIDEIQLGKVDGFS